MYKHSLLFALPDKEEILNNPGIRISPKGYIKDITKLINVSLRRNSWVFLYTKQNEDK